MMSNNLRTAEKIKAQRESFLSDPIISAWDRLLVEIYSHAIPIAILKNDMIVEYIYDENTQQQIDIIIRNRDEYIENTYKTKSEKRKEPDSYHSLYGAEPGEDI